MNTRSSIIEEMGRLIDEADELMKTHKQNPNEEVGFPTLSAEKFNDWKGRCMDYISDLSGENDTLVLKFANRVKGAYRSHVETGKYILKTIQDNIRNDYYQTHNK